MNNNIIITANAIALVSAFLMVGIGFIRDKRRILLVQSLQLALGGTSNLLLGGVSGCISNYLGIARNLCCVKMGMPLALKITLCSVQLTLTMLVSRVSALELIPLTAAFIYTFAIDTKNPVFLKLVMIGTQAMWLVYDFTMRNYVGFTFGLFAICSNFVSIAVMKGLIRPRAQKPRTV